MKKTVEEHGIVEEQLLDMGSRGDLIVYIKGTLGGRYSLTVFPNEEMREKGRPFELHRDGDHEDDIHYLSWDEIKEMELEQIFMQVTDVQALLDQMDEDAELMHEGMQETVKPYISVQKLDDSFGSVKMACDTSTGDWFVAKEGTLSYDTKEEAVKAALSWAKADGLRLIVNSEVMYYPENENNAK